MIKGRFEISHIQSWFEDNTPRFISLLFHWFDDALRNGYGGLVGVLARGGSPFDELGRKTEQVIKRVLVMVFLLLLVRFVVPAPSVHGGTSVLDTTTWIGILALEGSCTLAYIAIVPWLARINMRALLSLLTGGLRSDLITFKPDEQVKSVEEFESKAESEMDEKAVAKVMARPIVQGGLLLFGVVIFMVAGVWLTPRWKFAVLCMSVYWLWSLFQSLIIPAALTYSEVVLGIYNEVKGSHEQIKDRCKRCQMATSKASNVQGTLIVRRANKIGTGKWFVRIVWLVVWGTCIRSVGSTMWTWVLLFVPFYLRVLLLMITRLRKVLKKSTLTN